MSTRDWRRILGNAVRRAQLAGLTLALGALGCSEGGPAECYALYGPTPCESNQQCVRDYGPGYVCDPEHLVVLADENCEGTWPTCVPGPWDAVTIDVVEDEVQ